MSILNRLPQRTWARVLVAVVTAALVGGLTYGGVTVYTLAQATSQVKTLESAFPDESLRPTAAADEDGNGQNILLLGVDSYGNVGKSQDEITGTRSDSIMVAHISHDGQHLTLMSIVRDSWVDIPGIGMQRVNAAMSLGGVSTMVATVENLIDARIDHVAIIDFSGFKKAIDQIGGVKVCNTEYFTYSIYPHYEFDTGWLTLSGKEALAFARERKHLPKGDFSRAENQRKVVLSVFNQIMKSGVLKKPLQAAQLYESVAQYLSLDPTIDLGYALSTAGLLTSLADENGITTFTLTISGMGMESGMSVVYLDQEKLEVVRDHYANDTIHEYRKNEYGTTVTQSPSPSTSSTSECSAG